MAIFANNVLFGRLLSSGYPILGISIWLSFILYRIHSLNLNINTAVLYSHQLINVCIVYCFNVIPYILCPPFWSVLIPFYTIRIITLNKNGT